MKALFALFTATGKLTKEDFEAWIDKVMKILLAFAEMILEAVSAVGSNLIANLVQRMFEVPPSPKRLYLLPRLYPTSTSPIPRPTLYPLRPKGCPVPPLRSRTRCHKAILPCIRSSRSYFVAGAGFEC